MTYLDGCEHCGSFDLREDTAGRAKDSTPKKYPVICNSCGKKGYARKKRFFNSSFVI